MATTALCTSFKTELLGAGHNFNATVTPTASAGSASAYVSGVSSMAGVVVGMTVTGTNIPANTVVARITSNATFYLSQATTGAISAGTITVSGDVFKMALVKASPVGTFYDASFKNYGIGSGTSNTGNLGTDEVTGAGYVAGGLTLGNVSPTSSGTTAFTTFNPDPSWSGATFSTVAAIIYNTSGRTFDTGRAVGVYDLGGLQSVSGGTLTLVYPPVAAATALIRLA